MIHYLIMGLGALVFVVGLISFSKSEDEKIDQTNEAKNYLTAEMTAKDKKLEEHEYKITSLTQKMKTINDQLDNLLLMNNEAFNECSNVQEHCARLREDHIKIQKDMIKKNDTLKFQHVGAIPIEIHTPTKKKVITRRPAQKKTARKSRSRKVEK